MRALTIIFVVVISTITAAAQPSWRWVNNVTNRGSYYPFGIGSDRSGNIYTGSPIYGDTLSIGGKIISVNDSAGDTHGLFFIAKYSSNGELLWHQIIYGGNAYLDLMRLAVDAEGEVFVNVNFTEEDYWIFGKDTVGKKGSYLIDTDKNYVLKFDSEGNLIWHNDGYVGTSAGFSCDTSGNFSIHGTNTFTIYDRNGVKLAEQPTVSKLFISSTVLDNDHSMLFSGSNSVDTIIIGNDTLLPHGYSTTGIVVKSSASGDIIWDVPFTSSRFVSLAQLCADSLGSVFCGGYATGKLTIQDTTLFSVSDSDKIYWFISKITPSGKLEWIHALWAPANAAPAYSPMLTETSGYIYLTGISDSEVIVDGKTILSSSQNTTFLSCFDSLGRFRWILPIASETPASGHHSSFPLITKLPYGDIGIVSNHDSDVTLGNTHIFGSGVLVGRINAASSSVRLPSQPYREAITVQALYNHIVTFKLSASSDLNTVLEVYDLLGRRLISVPLNSSFTQVSLSQYVSGVYLYVLHSDERIVASGKFVLE